MNLLQSAPQAVSLWVMLGGGLVAFVSPCVLPMLPVYALYLAGGESRGWQVMLKRCLGLLLGFVLLFTLMGAGAGALGGALKNANRGTLDGITGAFLVLFGLWMLDILHPNLPSASGLMSRFHPTLNGFWGSFAFGLLIAVSWTPCLTPVLANALLLAVSADGATMWTGIASLAVFALGLCLPMLSVMIFYQWLKEALGWLRAQQHMIRRVAGAGMVLYGLYRLAQAFL